MGRFATALLFVLAGSQAEAAIVLDGRLDEPEWQQAQRLPDFKTTEPYTQAEPELATVALVHSDADGLYVGFICDQPPAVERVRTKGQRDAFVAGDRVNLMLDFDGSGTSAYEFTAYLGGEKQDAIISRQVNYNYDWDGDWDYAVSETESQWFVEYRIPWSVAPMGAAKDGRQDIGVFVSRVVVKTGRRYSLPGNAFNRATFVADMRKLSIASYSSAQLDLFPYLAASHDVLSEDTTTRAGLDLFWKPNGQHQLTATYNPDFGQVESDQLVVNFGAIPTFFPDKRPFFTENLGLFSTEFTVLYTRRIGAAPDAGSEGASDILGAVKYTGASADLNYGLIAAQEDDSSQAEGRDFYVGRARYKVADALTVGWIGTHTERPTLARRADVNALDFAWTLAPGISLNGQGAVSHVTQPGAGTFFDPVGTGQGSRYLFRYAPGGNLENITALVFKNRQFNINDAGFQSRPSDNVMQTVTTYFWRDWAESSSVQEQNLSTDLILHANDSGQRLPGYFRGVWTLVRRDTRQWGLQYQADSIGGVDDVLTRGNGNVRLPVNHRLDVFYQSPQSGLFRYYTQLGIGTSYFTDEGFHLFYAQPGFYPSDKFSVTSTLEFYDYSDNLIWQGGNLLGAYDYEQQYVSLDLNWFPRDRHELRLKFQWVAGSGGATRAYRPDSDGHLVATADPIDDFSFTDTALQLRYRYELAPLSELFVVYSHGGSDALADTERNLGSALRRGLARETASQLLVKLRYRFAVAG